MKKEIMKKAWKIAKEAVKKFGGKAIEEVMHKEGAYYGIEVVADGDSIGTYYIAEKVWEVA